MGVVLLFRHVHRWKTRFIEASSNQPRAFSELGGFMASFPAALIVALRRVPSARAPGLGAGDRSTQPLRWSRSRATGARMSARYQPGTERAHHSGAGTDAWPNWPKGTERGQPGRDGAWAGLRSLPRPSYTGLGAARGHSWQPGTIPEVWAPLDGPTTCVWSRMDAIVPYRCHSTCRGPARERRGPWQPHRTRSQSAGGNRRCRPARLPRDAWRRFRPSAHRAQSLPHGPRHLTEGDRRRTFRLVLARRQAGARARGDERG